MFGHLQSKDPNKPAGPDCTAAESNQLNQDGDGFFFLADGDG